jgi:hypothetical protein
MGGRLQRFRASMPGDFHRTFGKITPAASVEDINPALLLNDRIQNRG